MKRFLLLTAITVCLASYSSAQKVSSLKYNASQKQQVQKKSLKNFRRSIVQTAPFSAKGLITPARKNVIAKTSRRTYESGVFYGMHNGTYYSCAETSEGSYSYMLVPPLTEIVLPNLCTDKASALWSIGETAFEGDENNDFNYGWIPANDYVYNSPTVTVGSESYTFGATDDSYGLVATNGVYSLSPINDNLCQVYGAFTDSYAFGPDAINTEDGTVYMNMVVQEFKKPARPLYLEDVVFYFYSESGTPLPEGKTMQMRVYSTDEEGNVLEKLATVDITSQDFHFFSESKTQGYILATIQGVDELGLETAKGVVVKDAFTVVLDGYEQEGVDFGLRLVDITDDAYDFYGNGGFAPTVMYYYTADGEYARGMWYYQNSEKGKAQYNAELLIDGMFDVADAEEFENLIAPAEGGEIYAEIEGEGCYPQVYTTLPWESEDEAGVMNYQIEGLPSWITLDEVTLPTDPSESFICNIIKMTAEPLPAGETSRQAEIRIVSERGADTGVLTITQGEATGVSVTVKKVEKTTPAFNLAGQRVNSSYKGLVIKNSRKFMNK